MMEVAERVRYCLLMMIYNETKYMEKFKMNIKQCYRIV